MMHKYGSGRMRRDIVFTFDLYDFLNQTINHLSFSHLIDFCNGEDNYASGHPDFQYAALQILLNCVCTPSMIDQKVSRSVD